MPLTGAHSLHIIHAQRAARARGAFRLGSATICFIISVPVTRRASLIDSRINDSTSSYAYVCVPEVVRNAAKGRVVIVNFRMQKATRWTWTASKAANGADCAVARLSRKSCARFLTNRSWDGIGTLRKKIARVISEVVLIVLHNWRFFFFLLLYLLYFYDKLVGPVKYFWSTKKWHL